MESSLANSRRLILTNRSAGFLELIFDDLFLRIERRDIAQPERQDGRPDELFLGHARAFALFFEIVAAGGEERFLGDQTDELAARDPQAQFSACRTTSSKTTWIGVIL